MAESETEIESLETLSDMLREKRRLEAIALAADNAVLAQSYRIWKRFGMYPGAKLKPSQKEIPLASLPGTVTDAVRMIVNGESLSCEEVREIVRAQFPKLNPNNVPSALHEMSRPGGMNEFEKTGKHGSYRYTKRIP